MHVSCFLKKEFTKTPEILHWIHNWYLVIALSSIVTFDLGLFVTMIH